MEPWGKDAVLGHVYPWIATTGLLGVFFVGAPAQPLYEPARRDPQRDALRLLTHGHAYVDGVELPGDAESPETKFKGIDAPLAAFLEYPLMQPAVQFSCAVTDTPGEARLADGLDSRSDATALLALASLLHVQSPSTVAAQATTLERLRKARPKWRATLRVLERRFDAKALSVAIAQDPPADDRYGEAPELAWAIRAIGVRKYGKSLPRLATLCTSDHLDTSLAAERSIEDFSGPKADAALATCVEGRQYNAADRALDALLDRNPALARTTLLAMPFPSEDELSGYAHALLQVADASAVPRIIELIAALDAPRAAIDALEAHAQARHHAAVRDLIPQVDARHQPRLRALAQRLAPPPAA